MSQFAVGDLVEVLDEGLAMLRRVAPGMPPNHHGRIEAIDGDTIMVEFPIDGSYDGHSQSAPYPIHQVRQTIRITYLVHPDSVGVYHWY